MQPRPLLSRLCIGAGLQGLRRGAGAEAEWPASLTGSVQNGCADPCCKLAGCVAASPWYRRGSPSGAVRVHRLTSHLRPPPPRRTPSGQCEQMGRTDARCGVVPVGKTLTGIFLKPLNPSVLKTKVWNPVSVPKRSILLDVSVCTHRVWSGRDRPLAWVTVFSPELCHQCPVLRPRAARASAHPAHFFPGHVRLVVLIRFSARVPEKLRLLRVVASCVHFFRSVYTQLLMQGHHPVFCLLLFLLLAHQ